MDENEYRSAYHGLNSQRCVFEKSILTLNCGCRLHEKFNLAEREGIRCIRSEAQQNCTLFLNACRSRARFALHLTDIVGNLLPHSKEIQVQKGALLGLLPELPNQPSTKINDIYALIQGVMDASGHDPDNLPFAKLISSISHHPSRQKLRHRGRPKP